MVTILKNQTPRRKTMPDKVQWVLDYKEALSKAKFEGKFILLDFFNPE